MPMHKFYPLDSRLQHRAPGSAALTADTTLGSITHLGTTRTEALTKFYIESIDVAGGDEVYEIRVELSDDDFAGGDVERVAAIWRGGDATVITDRTDTPVGFEGELRWTNEVNGVVYPYVRIRLDGTGSTFSLGIHCYTTLMQ